MNKQWLKLSLIATILLLVLIASPGRSRPAAALSSDIVISEFRVRGPAGGNDEFIELYNLSDSPVNIGGWLVRGSNASGTTGTRATIPAGVTIDPGCYYLLTNSAASGYSGSVAGDQTYSTGVTDDGGIALTLADTTSIVDQVGMSTGSAFKEGTALTSLGSSNQDRGYERKPGGASGNGTDTDDNSADFQLLAPSNPQNSSSTCLQDAVDPVINEFSANTTGEDVEYIEVFGEADTDLSAFTILGIEGDVSGTLTGLIDNVYPVGTTDANGFWLLNLPANTLENGTLSLLLVEDFTGAQSDDLDTDDDGGFDVFPWTRIVDDVAIHDGGANDKTYAGTILTVSYDGLSFAPGGASRIPNGTDTNTTTDWVRNDFDLAGIPGFPGTLVEGEAFNTPGEVNTVTPAASAPSVASTSPANGASVNPDAAVSVTFSEAVTIAGTVEIDCTISGVQNVTPTTIDNITFTLPHSGFLNGDECTVTILADQVSDQDENDPLDNMAADYIFSFTVADVCVQPYTVISAIQGSGPATSIPGPVTTQGVVVGDYEGASPNLRGFYIQDPVGDGDPATSDGIFVFNGDNNSVNLGDVVRVAGTAAEFQDQTQISASSVALCGTGTVTPIDVTFPVPTLTHLEQYEGMLVRLPQTLYVTEHFQLGRFGQVVMSANDRLLQPTAVALPGAPALALQEANNLNRIIIDDALNNQNPDPILFGRGGDVLTASNTLRGGDTATGVVGIMTYTWAGHGDSGNAYRVRPVGALGGGVPDFQASNPRPVSAPEPTGSLRVMGFNLLNYFNTFDGVPDSVDNCSFGVGGPPADCRGADHQEEFDRQWPKTVAAIVESGADVIGIGEIENDGYGPESAIAELVDQLNDATAPGVYAFIDADALTGQLNALGTDAIKVGFIYKPASVTPVGQTAALNSVDFVTGGDDADRNRPALAQAFEENATGEQFIVVTNHLKSKGSACNAPDAGDGQGNCNIVRTNAANLLASWLASDPTGIGDSDILIVGDLNSYAMEDPIIALQNAGYNNLIAAYGGSNAFSYVFDGQWGYLDHALGSASATEQVTNVVEWHINADEPSVLDYNTNFKSPNLITTLYAPDKYRVSDHDPVLIDLALTPPDTSVYDFSGFFAPVNMPPLFNTVKPGSSIPLKFSLGGDYGLDVFAPGYPVSRPIDCVTGEPIGPDEPTLSTAGLTYKARPNQYTYVWKTVKGWLGCRELVMLFDDGTEVTALFEFTRR